jgi:predicted RNA methylase
MNHKKIFLNKLFPCPPDKNYNDLMIDHEAVSYITTPVNSDIISSIIDSHIPQNIARKNITIMDSTACVGGDTIAFGRLFGTVIATEIDKKRYGMLVNNLKKFELWNVVPINDDCLEIYQKVNFIDVVYFDPPWGGKCYKDKDEIILSIGNIRIDQIINNIFDGNVRSDIKIIILKLPKNYNLYDLYTKTKRINVTIYMYELNKMIIIVYKKNDYC